MLECRPGFGSAQLGGRAIPRLLLLPVLLPHSAHTLPQGTRRSRTPAACSGLILQRPWLEVEIEEEEEEVEVEIEASHFLEDPAWLCQTPHFRKEM